MRIEKSRGKESIEERRRIEQSWCCCDTPEL